MEDIISSVKAAMGEDYFVDVQEICVNNRCGEQAMTILKKGERAAPALALGPFYRRYQTGMPLDEISSRIVDEYKEKREDCALRLNKLDLDYLREWKYVRNCVVCRLIGAERNRKILEEVPHVRFLDMAIVYYYELEMEGDRKGSILIRSNFLPMWGITQEELDKEARENTAMLLPPVMLDMQDLIRSAEELQEGETDLPDIDPQYLDPGELADGEAMYVLTNHKKVYGAYWMSQENLLEQVRDALKEDFMILPSSIHEVILLPMHVEPDAIQLVRMVASINAVEVAEEEVLTDSVYCYRKGMGLSLAATARTGVFSRVGAAAGAT